LGMTVPQVKGLQQAAFDQLASEDRVTPAPLVLPRRVAPQPCVM
jgi:hypothetical protein